MNYLKITHDKLNIEQLKKLASSPKCEPGGISTFVETHSDNSIRKEASHLSYKAYESRALAILEVICEEIREKWPEIENIVIYHRSGSVPVQEARVGIAISSPHRKDAVSATEWCISDVQSRVPIWKKESESAKERPGWPEKHKCVWCTNYAKQCLLIWKEESENAKERPESQENCKSHLPKRKIYCTKKKQRVHMPYSPRPYQIQLNVNSEVFRAKVENLIDEKRAELNRNNIQEFTARNVDPEFTCARADSAYKRRPDSSSHLQVSTVMNTLHRDQSNADYLLKYMPLNGIEERLQNLESHLGITAQVSVNIDERLKLIEHRVMLVESLSPEYISFWKKTDLFTKPKKKPVFSLKEADSMIEDFAARRGQLHIKKDSNDWCKNEAVPEVSH